LQVPIILLFPNQWANAWCICHQSTFKSVTKRCYICDQSAGKSVTILYQSVTMPNTNMWRFKHYIYDGCKMMSQQPRHWWRHNLVICQRGIRHPMTNTRLHLWRIWIVTPLQRRHPLSRRTEDCDEKISPQNALTVLTAASVSPADMKLWRKHGIIYDQNKSS
jgi:hypothetical protein